LPGATCPAASLSAASLSAAALAVAVLKATAHLIVSHFKLLGYWMARYATALKWTFAARHTQNVGAKLIVLPCVNDGIQITVYVGNQLDAIGREHVSCRARYRPTYHHLYAQVGEPPHFQSRQWIVKAYSGLRRDVARLRLHHMDFAGNVEKGGDAIVPYRESRFHCYGSPEERSCKGGAMSK
jgi:hypothetical protein